MGIANSHCYELLDVLRVHRLCKLTPSYAKKISVISILGEYQTSSSCVAILMREICGSYGALATESSTVKERLARNRERMCNG
mmetsp:Transcript_13336/g.26104  ORF Transcript_13336/g.26104 Transcript_13336/m.26104 type:complete len:83 (+) Transcript_13336:965-1213(+)